VERLRRSSWLFPLLVIAALAWLASETLRDDRQEERATYSEVIDRAEQSPTSIDLVVFDPRRQGIEVRLRDGQQLETNYPSDESQVELERLLRRQNIRFDSKGSGSSAFWTLLSTVLPFVLLLGFWVFLMNQTQRFRSPSRDEPHADLDDEQPRERRW
jgi:cell division protease FtsH